MVQKKDFITIGTSSRNHMKALLCHKGPSKSGWEWNFRELERFHIFKILSLPAYIDYYHPISSFTVGLYIYMYIYIYIKGCLDKWNSSYEIISMSAHFMVLRGPNKKFESFWWGIWSFFWLLILQSNEICFGLHGGNDQLCRFFF